MILPIDYSGPFADSRETAFYPDLWRGLCALFYKGKPLTRQAFQARSLNSLNGTPGFIYKPPYTDITNGTVIAQYIIQSPPSAFSRTAALGFYISSTELINAGFQISFANTNLGFMLRQNTTGYCYDYSGLAYPLNKMFGITWSSVAFTAWSNEPLASGTIGAPLVYDARLGLSATSGTSPLVAWWNRRLSTNEMALVTAQPGLLLQRRHPRYYYYAPAQAGFLAAWAAHSNSQIGTGTGI